ncbi:MAG: type IX secretion system membrane protein PorP/SprF [Salibacteraceae bacterium]
MGPVLAPKGWGYIRLQFALRYALFVLALILTLPVWGQQDPQFNQYMFNPLGINPAYAGSRDALSMNLLYRNQWLGVDGAPVSQTFSIHTPLLRRKIGVGFQVTNESIGAKDVISIMGTYAYRIRLGPGKLAFGLRGGIYNYAFDWNKIEYRDEDDMFADMNKDSYVLPNFDFGMYYNTRKFFVGIEAAHLNSPDLEFASTTNSGDGSRLERHLSAIVGKAFVINKTLAFRPSMLIKQAGATPAFVDVNTNFLFNDVLWLGVGYRSGYGGLAIAEYVIKKRLRIGYSYDFAFNSFRGNAGGSHEIFLGYDLNLSLSKMVSPRVFF